MSRYFGQISLNFQNKTKMKMNVEIFFHVFMGVTLKKMGSRAIHYDINAPRSMQLRISSTQNNRNKNHQRAQRKFNENFQRFIREN